MSNRVHGIRILVGAGLALPNQPLTPRRAQQAAPLRFRYHNGRQSSDLHHSLKSNLLRTLELLQPRPDLWSHRQCPCFIAPIVKTGW